MVPISHHLAAPGTACMGSAGLIAKLEFLMFSLGFSKSRLLLYLQLNFVRTASSVGYRSRDPSGLYRKSKLTRTFLDP